MEEYSTTLKPIEVWAFDLTVLPHHTASSSSPLDLLRKRQLRGHQLCLRALTNLSVVTSVPRLPLGSQS